MDVPGYTEIRELGHGGTGRVMLAVRDSDGLAVAIKHLSGSLRQDEEFVERFRAEALLIQEIDSPHTARLLDYVESPGDAVIVMELVDGITLRRLLEHEGRTGAEAALVLLKGALLGLAEAHRRGVVHRDFKPENVLVTQDGESKLVDFGVAARFGEKAALVGTPSYMAPEQWDDAPAGPATDVYAATVVFFECLTGHRPFHGENIAALAYQHQNAAPPLEDVEEPLRPLVAHGLAKDPGARPESAEAFLAELEGVALAAYGDGWEQRGRTGLGILTVPLAAMLPRVQEAASGNATTSMFQSTLSPVGKFAVTGGLVLATAAAVVSAFVMLREPPALESGTALPPATSAPPRTAGPASPTSGPPTPSDSLTETPPVTLSGDPTAGPSGFPTAPPTRGPMPTTSGPRPEPPPGTREPTGRPDPEDPTRSEEPRPSTRPPTSAPPDDNPPSNPPPSDDDPAPPPPTSAPEPTAPPPAEGPGPLISVSVGVSLNVPLLGDDGDGLLDADVGVRLDSSLLGMLVVPGSVLLGRHIVARSTRRPRDGGRR
ncbi:serine/threonine-protein kinase [Nonomuraea sp. SYSU D8015]|uniref:serine/threonine-protein kinase n=1 Tax=Nonomuraea sp. SYSU D8015 TaxID=2593644 RepID=UPI0016614FBE|nr:serine/threonine-protein kinase [Nonomuraea sp. SYSU D8015]